MAALRRFVGVGLQGAARACRCLSTSASDGATLLQSWTQSPLALTMQPRDVQNVEPSVRMSDAWASPLAIHYLVNSSAGLTPLCVADVETGLEALQAGEGAGPAMYADSVRRKRKHKMNKHKHRKRLKLQRQ